MIGLASTPEGLPKRPLDWLATLCLAAVSGAGLWGMAMGDAWLAARLLQFMEVVHDAGSSFAFPTRSVHLIREGMRNERSAGEP